MKATIILLLLAQVSWAGQHASSEGASLGQQQAYQSTWWAGRA
uniref:Decorin isoform 4 n=1 Tax=Homo sapiens TaxID=9606 RepID=A0A0S2Z3L3_HUMAN|nr:decorin isoform 4 [Homo sapiens]